MRGTAAAAPPTVSVIMAAYNGAAWIDATIASVLGQSFDDFELIVVDDASTDDTLARLNGYDDPRLVVLPSARNGGPVVARNRAFAAARGRYIAGLDQDDLCHPDRLARQVAWLDAHPETVLLGTAMQDFWDDGRTRTNPDLPVATSPMLLAWRLLFRNPLGWSTVMLRADTARRLPVFERPERLYAEDFDLYHRMARLGPIARLDTPLLYYRRHAGGASNRFTQRMLHSAADVLAEAYRPIFGPDAAAAATRVIRQGGGDDPVPSAADLAELSRIVARVHAFFIRTHTPDEDDLALIRAEYARFWWGIARGAIRAGHVSVAAAIKASPSGIASRFGNPARLMLCGLIGSSRTLGTGRARAR